MNVVSLIYILEYVYNYNKYTTKAALIILIKLFVLTTICKTYLIFKIRVQYKMSR